MVGLSGRVKIPLKFLDNQQKGNQITVLGADAYLVNNLRTPDTTRL